MLGLLSLGIIENNFKQITNPDFDTTLLTSIGDNKLMPDWYLYGEKALLERVKLLENRKTDVPFIPELIALDDEKIKLESFNIDQSGANSIQISQVAVIPTIPFKPNKRLIVLLAFFGSFMVSIALALLMNLFKEDETEPTTKTSR